MLELKGLHLKEGDFELRADLSLQAAGRYAVIGPSGAGKSTLLDAIAGFRPLVSGTVSWNGQAFTDLTPAKRPLAMLFQDNNLFPHLTVDRNLALAFRPDGGRIGAEGREKIVQALADVGLAGMGGRKPAQLSGGQQSRAALARVVLQERPIMLLDEPFSALGPALKVEMLDLLAKVADRLQALVLIVTHDPNDARRFAPETVLVSDGVAHAPQPTGPLLDNPPPALAQYLGGA
ncbi:MAG: ATP-binding cassette domain-containing protein [Pseudomonadota bacterium]|nr:ATP-binding cassette domain-containing protein [Pseudomonadota bacterium]